MQRTVAAGLPETERQFGLQQSHGGSGPQRLCLSVAASTPESPPQVETPTAVSAAASAAVRRQETARSSGGDAGERHQSQGLKRHRNNESRHLKP